MAIAYEDITNTNFKSFDQNWTEQVGEIITHDYGYILGYLRSKSAPTPTIDRKKSIFPWVIYMKKLRDKY